MAELALAVPFVGLVEPVGVPQDLPAHVTDFQPYGGTYASVIPHLTVAQSLLDETALLVEPLLPLASRVESVVLYTSVDSVHWAEHSTFDLGG